MGDFGFKRFFLYSGEVFIVMEKLVDVVCIRFYSFRRGFIYIGMDLEFLFF